MAAGSRHLWSNAAIVNGTMYVNYVSPASNVSGVSMYLCGFGCLWLCLFGCVLQGPIRLKVLWGTVLGTNEILASKHCFVAVKGTLNCHFGSSQFCHLLLQLKVFRSITLKYLHDSNDEWCNCLIKGSYFSVAAGSRHLWSQP